MSSRNSSPARSASTRLSRNSLSRSSKDVKSSGFYPTSMSPTARMAIVDHMDSHYKRVQNAKAVVDTTPPKSYQLSRSTSPSRSSHSSRPNSRSSLRTNESQFTEVNREEVMRSTNKINYYLEAMRREQQRLFSQLAASNFRRPKTYSSSSACMTAGRHKHLDLIEKHAENFTKPENPFVPRVLKSNAKSKLRENRWYNPPRRKEIKRTDSSDAFDEYEKEWEDDISDRSQSTAGRKIGSKGSNNNANIKDGRKYFSRWLDDQLCVSENRIKVLSKSSSQELEPSRNDISMERGRVKSPKKSEDSLPYLQFIVDVTNDILIRGIYTNKVLKQVFASHLERRKNELKMDQMEAALKQLQIDLGISDSDDYSISTHSFGYGSQSAIQNGYQHAPLRDAPRDDNNLADLDFLSAHGQNGFGGDVLQESVASSHSDVKSVLESSYVAQSVRSAQSSTKSVSKMSVVEEKEIGEQSDSVSDATYDKESFESDSEENITNHDQDVAGSLLSETINGVNKNSSQMDELHAKDDQDSQIDDFY